MILDVQSAVKLSEKWGRQSVESSTSKATATVADKSLWGNGGIGWDGSNQVPLKRYLEISSLMAYYPPGLSGFDTTTVRY